MSKPDEDVVAVRTAAGALQFISSSPATFASFRHWLLRDWDDAPLGVSRDIFKDMTLAVAKGVYEQFVLAMRKDGFG